MTDHQVNILIRQIAELTKKVDENATNMADYIKNDEAWKADNQQALDNMRNITSTGKFLVWVVITVGALATAGLAIRDFIHKP